MEERNQYAAFSIPKRESESEAEAVTNAWNKLAKAVLHPNSQKDEFVEIEYEHNPKAALAVKTASQSFTLVPASQLIGKPRTIDPIKEKFLEMRRLAYDNPFSRDDAGLFYTQAKFMEDFSDSYPENEPLLMYYPYYQNMSYEQLRTYFTWRTRIRSGEFPATSLSYVFLYIYELLSGVGTDSPADGLDRLMAIWMTYRGTEPALDKYLPRWLRDFHIYYELPCSFGDFIDRHGMRSYYPELFLSGADAGNSLILWNALSGYDVSKSKFYNDGNEELMNDCFYSVLGRIRTLCAERDVRIEDLLLYRISKGAFWRPFDGALFHHWLRQPDRVIEIPGGETFYCNDNRWTADISIHYSGRRELVGYLIKKTEACLRGAAKYKYSIKAERDMLPGEVLRKLKEAGIPFAAMKKTIEKTVSDYHSSLKPVIKVEVDHLNLVRIRDEALSTQNKLIVPEESEKHIPLLPVSTPMEEAAPPENKIEPAPGTSDVWASLKCVLSDTQRGAITLALHGNADIKAFADENGVMPELLADSINEKAMDYVGDNILELDGGLVMIYDEYIEKVREMVE